MSQLLNLITLICQMLKTFKPEKSPISLLTNSKILLSCTEAVEKKALV